MQGQAWMTQAPVPALVVFDMRMRRMPAGKRGAPDCCVIGTAHRQPQWWHRAELESLWTLVGRPQQCRLDPKERDSWRSAKRPTVAQVAVVVSREETRRWLPS